MKRVIAMLIVMLVIASTGFTSTIRNNHLKRVPERDVAKRICSDLYDTWIECMGAYPLCKEIATYLKFTLMDEFPRLVETIQGRVFLNIIAEGCYLACATQYLPDKKTAIEECLHGYEKGLRIQGIYIH